MAGTRRRTSRWRVVIVLGTVMALAGAGMAGIGASAKAAARPSRARPSASTEVVAPFAEVVDYSACADPVLISCTVDSDGTLDGRGRSVASVQPEAAAGSGRAVAEGGWLAKVQVAHAAAALRLTFHFSETTAITDTRVQPVCADGTSLCPQANQEESNDLAVRAMIGGYVAHSACAACASVVREVIADVHDGTPDVGPEAPSASRAVVVEVRNPDGLVPTGTISAVGLLTADLRPALGRSQPLYASSGSAQVSGTLARIAIERLPA